LANNNWWTSGDFNQAMAMSQDDYERIKREQQKMIAMATGQQNSAPAPKPEKPKHLNPKLLILKRT
jgi:hypothetical protein